MNTEIKFKKVAVIMGGYSKEREISLLSGNAVLESLLKSGVNAIKFDPKESKICKLLEDGFDSAVIMLHGRCGEDGSIQGALETMGIPYTGSGVMASSLSMDKYRTKLIWQSMGIPMAKSQRVTKEVYNKHGFELDLDLPVVVKPVREGSTIGLSKVFDYEELDKGLSCAFEYDNEILVEEMIIGDEYTITVCNGRCYPLIKIEAPMGEYNYQNKYFTDETQYLCPYDVGVELTRQIEDYAILAYELVGATGVARIDFMLDKNNGIYFLEINTIPGMTGHSLVPIAYKAAGFSFDELCLQMLNDAKLNSF